MSLQWVQANAWGISTDVESDAWHAGHLADAVPLADTSVLVGSDSGGAWVLTPDSAESLSDSWDDPDIRTLGAGPDGPGHVYCMSTATLRESRSWKDVSFVAIPAPSGQIFDLAGTFGSRRQFAASTDGLFVAAVPGPGRARDYAWTPVRLSPDPGTWVTSVAVRATGGSWALNSSVAVGTASLTSSSGQSRVSFVARRPINRDLFWVAQSGSIQTAYSHVTTGPGADPWLSYEVVGDGAVHPDSALTAVSRTPDHLDLFWVGPDGSVRSTWWDAAVAAGWTGHEFTISGAGAANPAPGVAAVCRLPGQIDVFWVSPDGAMWTSWWSASTSTWAGHAYRIVGPGQVGAASTVVAVAPHADRLDVLWVSPSGSVMHTRWDVSAGLAWPTPSTVSTSPSRVAAGGLAATARTPTHVDVFWAAGDGSLWTAWRDDSDAAGWAGHAYLVAPPGTCATTTRVSACSRNGNHLDVMWTDVDGELSTTWWDATRGTSLAHNIYRPYGGRLPLCTMIAQHEDALCAVVAHDTGTVDMISWCADSVEVAVGTQSGRIFHGTVGPTDPSPVLTEAAITGIPSTVPASGRSRTSVAFSRYTSAAFAVMARSDVPDDSSTVNFLAVLKASPDGATWDGANPPTTVDEDAVVTLAVAAGAQGVSYNNCIAVSPLDQNLVAIGWQNGVFATADAGRTFDKWMRPEKPIGPHLHADVHRVRFDPGDRSGRRLLIASDGGLAVTPDAGTTMVSRYNRRLANLQCYTTDAAGRDASGTLGGGSEVAGLVTCGLQDNGNVWSLNQAPWQRFTGGDGGVSLLTRERQVLTSEGLDGGFVQRAEWDATSQTVTTPSVDIPITAGAPGDSSPTLGPGGFAGLVNEPVNMDAFGAKIYAIGFRNNQLFGFWNPTGFASWRWEFIAALPLAAGESISTAGSANGNVVLAATSHGNFFRVDRHATPVLQPNDAFDPDYGVNVICIIDDDNAFALYNVWRGSTSGGKILRLSAGRWTEVARTLSGGGTIPNERCYAVETDWTLEPPPVFVCTDTSVYVLSDSGQWSEQSAGLPTRGHLADFQFVLNPDGTKELLLSTWGRSVWRAPV